MAALTSDRQARLAVCPPRRPSVFGTHHSAAQQQPCAKPVLCSGATPTASPPTSPSILSSAAQTPSVTPPTPRPSQSFSWLQSSSSFPTPSPTSTTGPATSSVPRCCATPTASTSRTPTSVLASPSPSSLLQSPRGGGLPSPPLPRFVGAGRRKSTGEGNANAASGGSLIRVAGSFLHASPFFSTADSPRPSPPPPVARATRVAGPVTFVAAAAVAAAQPTAWSSAVLRRHSPSASLCTVQRGREIFDCAVSQKRAFKTAPQCEKKRISKKEHRTLIVGAIEGAIEAFVAWLLATSHARVACAPAAVADLHPEVREALQRISRLVARTQTEAASDKVADLLWERISRTLGSGRGKRGGVASKIEGVTPMNDCRAKAVAGG